MVTGASTADAAIVLVDITRVQFADQFADDGQQGLVASLLAQTKRHTAIAAKLGVPTVIFAVNKMDLVAFNQAQFNATAVAVQALAHSVGIAQTHVLPISALAGDNIVKISDKTPWYQGQTLLGLLEQVPSLAERAAASHSLGFRFPVQWVARHDGHTANDFRGYMGRVENGSIAVGAAITILPAQLEARVARIVTLAGDVPSAHAGQCVTLVLDRDVDVSRGDQFVLADDAHPPASTKKITADICWLKNTTRQVQAKVQRIDHVLDIHTLSHGTHTSGLAMNDIARVELVLSQAIVADLYAQSRGTGSFILIDAATHQTAAAGMVVGV